VRRDGLRVRCFTRNGNDWADRFPVIVEAAARLKAQSFLIDGEVVIARDDGTPGAARWSKGQYQSNASGSRVA
jgi:ATP-dependent DNA ligase